MNGSFRTEETKRKKGSIYTESRTMEGDVEKKGYRRDMSEMDIVGSEVNWIILNRFITYSITIPSQDMLEFEILVDV
jgi:hypothetical protein